MTSERLMTVLGSEVDSDGLGGAGIAPADLSVGANGGFSVARFNTSFTVVNGNANNVVPWDSATTLDLVDESYSTADPVNTAYMGWDGPDGDDPTTLRVKQAGWYVVQRDVVVSPAPDAPIWGSLGGSGVGGASAGPVARPDDIQNGLGYSERFIVWIVDAEIQLVLDGSALTGDATLVYAALTLGPLFALA